MLATSGRRGAIIEVAAGAPQSPILVDQATYDRAQAALTSRQKNASRNRQYDYLLSGQLNCAHCGGIYTGRTGNHGAQVYYFCARERDGKRCIGKPIDGKAKEAEIWEAVQAYYLNPGSLITAVERTQADDKLPALEAELTTVVAALTDIAGQRESVNLSIDKKRRSEEEGDAALAILAKAAEPLQRRRGDLELDIRAARDANAATFRGLLQPADAAEEIAVINATNDRDGMRRIIRGTVIKAEAITHLNRKKLFVKLYLAAAPDMPITVPSPRRPD